MQSQLEILFIDDHSGLRDGISFLISQENPHLKFCNASTKEQALSILKENPDISNAIIDINLDGSNGLDFIDEFRSIKPDLNVIIFTMYNDLLHVEAALKKNIQGYITKDASIEELQKAISYVADGNLYYNKTAKKIMHSMIYKDTNQFSRNDEYNTVKLFENYKTLTPAEQEVFLFLAKEKDVYEIAKLLNKSEKTVQNQKSIICQKMNVSDRLDIVRAAQKLGVIL